MASMVEYNLIDNFYGQFNFISTEKNEKSDSGNVLNLTVTKRTDNGDVVIGKKSFSWPDSSTAEVITYDSDNDILKMESSSYVAELSLKLPKSCIIVGKRDKEPVKIFKGFGNKSIDTSSTPLIVNKLKEILNNEKIVNWNELNEISKTFIKTSTLLIDPFTTMEQDLLVDLILNNHKESSLLLEALLHGKFFSMNSSSKLLEKLIEINDLQTLELLINDGSFPITDIIFTKLLKCAIDSKTDKGFNFFKKLLNRGFGSNMLTLEIEKQLSVKDALKLLEWLICMPLKENKDDSFGNLVEFASILLDSHFHKFVWDDTCHDLLRRFYLWTQSWITLAESFTSFSESTEVMKALSVQMEDLLNYNSGYTISKVVNNMKINSLRIAPGFPGLEDHQQIQILVVNLCEDVMIGGESSFCKLLNRLNDHSVKKVGDQEPHYVYIKFITQNDPLNLKFANLQVYRRIFAVIGVAFLNDDDNIKETYDKYENLKKSCDEDALVDNRLLIFGGNKEKINGENLREIIYYENFKDTQTFNYDIQGLLKNVIIILQSKRLEDINEVKRCPLLSGEEKYQVGLDKQSKNYKKKCIGRLKKQIGDLHMLLGLPSQAVDIYNIAIENLKSANDLLWLAAAYEGLAVASYYALIGNEPLYEGKKSTVQRNHTINNFDTKNIDGTYKNFKKHSRRNSDEFTKNLSTTFDEKIKLKGFLKNIGKLTIGNKGGFIDIPSIMDKFILSIENFERFSYSAKIEYQCVIKAASLLFWEHDFIKCEAFLREHIGKYLDDSFVTFNNFEKSSICVDCANIFKEMNFMRKHAFFSRLAVLFRLHVSDEEPRTENDYKYVYPLLYNTLTGYGIQLKSPLDINKKKFNLNISGPSQIQVKAIQEVFMSSLRGGLVHSSIRHLCFLLQNYYDLLDQKAIDSMLDELKKLTSKLQDKHNLNQIIQLDYCNVLIPAVQWTKFPTVIDIELKPLKHNLDINIITKRGSYGDIFIYSPFQQGHNNVKIYWSVDCYSTVTLKIINCFHFELTVTNLILLVDGCDFESIPIKLHLPPTIKGQQQTIIDVDMQGFPHSEGTLKFIGYSCEVLGVKNVVKFDNEQFIKTIRVLPKLPILEVDTTLEKQLLKEENHFETQTEVTLFSGQKFNHTITITNTSDTINIRNIRIKIQQPKISGGPQLISILENFNKDFILLPKTSKDFKISIYGIDPTTAPENTTETFPVSSLFSKHISDNNFSIVSSTNNLLFSEIDEQQISHDLIPYIGRLLNSTIKITYAADLENDNNEIYERTYSIGIAIKIIPAITISNWHVLSGEDASTRYIVLDVNNLTDYDAELNYLHNKQLSVQAKDTCRVLLLCSCCGEISPFAFSHASQRPSFHMQKEEIEKLRRILEDHVSNHLNIKWSIPKLNINGNVPVGSLLSSVSCLKQLVVPLLTVTLSINMKPYTSEDDIIVYIGDIVTFNITLLVSTKASFNFSGTISLLCFHDLQNGEEHIYVPESLISIGSLVVPFNVQPQQSDGLLRIVFKKDFRFMFRYEGIYKVKPNIFLNKCNNIEEQKLLQSAEKEFFISTASFNVTTKGTK